MINLLLYKNVPISGDDRKQGGRSGWVTPSDICGKREAAKMLTSLQSRCHERSGKTQTQLIKFTFITKRIERTQERKKESKKNILQYRWI